MTAQIARSSPIAYLARSRRRDGFWATCSSMFGTETNDMRELFVPRLTECLSNRSYRRVLRTTATRACRTAGPELCYCPPCRPSIGHASTGSITSQNGKVRAEAQKTCPTIPFIKLLQRIVTRNNNARIKSERNFVAFHGRQSEPTS